jgi:hypothetical protein
LTGQVARAIPADDFLPYIDHLDVAHVMVVLIILYWLGETEEKMWMVSGATEKEERMYKSRKLSAYIIIA